MYHFNLKKQGMSHAVICVGVCFLSPCSAGEMQKTLATVFYEKWADWGLGVRNERILAFSQFVPFSFYPSYVMPSKLKFILF